MVLIPGEAADETTMGEWLEDREAVYISTVNGRRDTPVFEFHFKSKDIADTFARTFIG
jgi:hypothetical protein